MLSLTFILEIIAIWLSGPSGSPSEIFLKYRVNFWFSELFVIEARCFLEKESHCQGLFENRWRVSVLPLQNCGWPCSNYVTLQDPRLFICSMGRDLLRRVTRVVKSHVNKRPCRMCDTEWHCPVWFFLSFHCHQGDLAFAHVLWMQQLWALPGCEILSRGRGQGGVRTLLWALPLPVLGELDASSSNFKVLCSCQQSSRTPWAWLVPLCFSQTHGCQS